eukprot:Em0001g722a
MRCAPSLLDPSQGVALFLLDPSPGVAPFLLDPSQGVALFLLDPSPGVAPFLLDPSPGVAPFLLDPSPDPSPGVAPFLLDPSPGVAPFLLDPSPVLDRVKHFMPAMQQAQEELKGKMAEELDIEVVDDMQPHIQMELAVVPLASSDSGSGDTSSDSEDGDLPQPPVLKLPKTRRAKKRCIEELEPSK